MPTRSPSTRRRPGWTTRPTTWWPGTSGSFGSGSSPSTTWRSVRQTPQASTATSTWPSPGSGAGSTASRRGVPGRSSTSACIGLAGDPLSGLLEHLAEDRDDLVELGLLRDERRRDLDDGIAAVVGPADEPGLEEPRREEAAEERLALLLREGLARLLVFHELEGVEEARPAEVADDRQVEQLRQRRVESLLLGGDVVDDVLAVHDLDVLERDRRLHRVAAEGDAVHVHGRPLHERLHHPVGGDDRADGGVGRREPLRRRDDVGADVVALGAEPRA